MIKNILVFGALLLSAMSSYADPVECYREATNLENQGGAGVNGSLAVILCGDSYDLKPVDCYKKATSGTSLKVQLIAKDAVELCKKK